MQVILLDNIEGLGRKGDQVDVRNGHGRNYLLPHGKAVEATADVLSRLHTMKAKFAVEEAKIVASLKDVAAKLEGLSVELTMRATPEGHLFGSVSAHVISGNLAAKGIEVHERDIRIKEPIKSVGNYTVAIHLHADVQVAITVKVAAEGAPAEAEAAEAAAAAPAPAADGAAAPAASES